MKIDKHSHFLYIIAAIIIPISPLAANHLYPFFNFTSFASIANTLRPTIYIGSSESLASAPIQAAWLSSQNFYSVENITSLLHATNPIPSINIFPILTSADFNLVPSDTADHSIALQQFFDRAGILLLLPGRYNISVPTLHLRGDTILVADGAEIHQMNDALTDYGIFAVESVQNVAIHGACAVGNRNICKLAGEHGHGFRVRSSRNIIIINSSSVDNFGDGFYIGQLANTGEIHPASTSVVLEHCLADNNRRQGLSITSARDVKIMNCTFTHTQGTAPESGIDIEPNANQNVENILIRDCTLMGNARMGISLFARSVNANINHIMIIGCHVHSNRGYGVWITGCTANIAITSGQIINNRMEGIHIDYTLGPNKHHPTLISIN